MIFFSLMGFAIILIFPWWCILPFSFALGWIFERGVFQVAVASFSIWFIAAFYQNALNFGLIASRLSTLLQIHPYLTFALTGLVAALLAAPAFLVGCYLKALIAPRPDSRPVS